MIKTGGILSINPFFNVVSAETDSGYPELEVTATLPTNTSVFIRVFEDTDADGASENQQEKEISDGTATYTYNALDGFEGQGIEYWLDIQLSGDGSDTPQVSSITLTLPESEPEDNGTGEDTETWFDDFENGNVDGWYNEETNTDAEIDTLSTNGQYSLLGRSSNIPGSPDNPSFEWIEGGPTLDLQNEFIVEATMLYQIGDTSEGSSNIRIGLTGSSQGEEGENVYLIFDYGDNETLLGTHANDTMDNPITNDFINTWVNIKLQSDEGSDTIRAKVWDVGGSEPTEYQLERSDFGGRSGVFGVNPGFDDIADRQIYLDDIEITGTVFVPDEHDDLYIDGRNFVRVGETIPFKIRYNDPQDGWVRITETVDSLDIDDPSVISVDQTAGEIEGLERGETFITLEHEDLVSGHNISSGEIVIGDIELLPPMRKVEAIISDTASQVIFAATFIGLFTQKLIESHGNNSNTWISLGSAFGVIMLAGFQGWIGNGIVFSALFFVILASIIIGDVRQNEMVVVNEGQE